MSCSRILEPRSWWSGPCTEACFWRSPAVCSRDVITPPCRLGTCLLLLSRQPIYQTYSQWKPGHLRDTCVCGREELMCSQPCLCWRLCLKCRACPHLKPGMQSLVPQTGSSYGAWEGQLHLNPQNGVETETIIAVLKNQLGCHLALETQAV